MPSPDERGGSPRSRILDAAASLLRAEGPEAVTTRGTAEEAGVQPPAIYRLFGSKEGLLDAVVEHVMALQASEKAARLMVADAVGIDPVEDLRAGWQSQIEFGLENPALFRLLSDPGRVNTSPGARMGRETLQARVHRIALTGRLAVAEPRAVDMIGAAGVGVIHILLAAGEDRRDPRLADAMFDAVLDQILRDPPPAGTDGVTAPTVAFRAITPELTALSEPERLLLEHWLDRILVRT